MFIPQDARPESLQGVRHSARQFAGQILRPGHPARQ
jgi:hypothetical protein